MKEKELNPNLASGILLAAAVLVILVLMMPISIRVEPLSSAAQEAAPQTVEYTLKMVIGLDPAMSFVGVGGSIDGKVNPDLTANVGDTVKLTVINGDAVLHDLKIDVFNITTGEMKEKDQSVTLTFTPDKPGEFIYYCSAPGHQLIGMEGKLLVSGEAAPQTASTTTDTSAESTTAVVQPTAPTDASAVSIIKNPADLPPPVGNRAPMNVRVDLSAVEVSGQLAGGATFTYFTFNNTVPGPMIRVRVGDTVEVHLKNETSSEFVHSIDLHATTGPGGGAVYTQTKPGEETVFNFQGLNPGLYVYHCATPSVAHHIANGMYGLILVEPEEGLPPVSREFYIMQGEIYTAQPFGSQGHLDFSHEKMLNEQPEYFVFNGAAGALTQDDYAPRAKVGDTVRIFFGVGGPNFISSFHVIGEIFDRVYDQASLTSPPLTDVQTTLVPPGGATMVEFQLQVPGRYILVDHALSRLERGLAGFLYAEGEENPSIFQGAALSADSGH